MNDPATGNDTPEHEAQRTLEQRALRNVRVLVDAMEAHEESERRTGKRLMVILAALLLVVAIAIAFAMMGRQSEPKAPVVRPVPAARVPAPQ